MSGERIRGVGEAVFGGQLDALALGPSVGGPIFLPVEHQGAWDGAWKTAAARAAPTRP